MPYTARFVAPLATQLGDSTGELVGTGVYVDLGNGTGVLTNEHVPRERRGEQLANTFLGSAHYYVLDEPALKAPYPVDAAIIAMDDKVWSARPGTSNAVARH